jgi:hypothetical protein
MLALRGGHPGSRRRSLPAAALHAPAGGGLGGHRGLRRRLYRSAPDLGFPFSGTADAMAVPVHCNVCGDEIALDQDEDLAAVADMLTFTAAHQDHARFSVDLRWGAESEEGKVLPI